MDRRLEITPEMCGTNWVRILLICASTTAISVAVELIIDDHRSIFVGLAVGLFILLAETVDLHQKLRYELHLADAYISARYPSGGFDVIHKNEIRKLRETGRMDPRGHGIIVSGPHRLLHHRIEIFVPRDLPEFEFVRQTLASWLDNMEESVPLSPRGLPYSQE